MTESLNIVAPNPEWSTLFEQEAARVSAALDKLRHELLHVGSTAIRGAHAKPVIDMLLLVDNLDELDARASNLARLGYEGKGEYGIPARRYFRKTSATGSRTHNIHAYVTGSNGAVRHIAFRDYMNAHPIAAAEYSALKLALVCKQGCDAALYIAGKDEFIRHHEALAIKWANSSTNDA